MSLPTPIIILSGQDSELFFLLFFVDGADIIITNTYQSSVDGYMQHLHLNREQSLQLICTSVRLAKEARQLYLQSRGGVKSNSSQQPARIEPYIMGSVGPYAAILNDGSEYRGGYQDTVTKSSLQEWHLDRLTALCEAGVDGLAVETIPSRLEAESVTELILSRFPQARFWVTFQCQDEQNLAHGEPFAEAALSIWKMVKSAGAEKRCCGIGVNCLNPQVIIIIIIVVHHHPLISVCLLFFV